MDSEIEKALASPAGARAARVLLEAQLSSMGRPIPPEVQGFLRDAHAPRLLKWAVRIANVGVALENIFAEEYEDLAREEFAKLLEARFGTLSAELRAGVGWLEGWQLDEYRSCIESASSAEAIVFCTGAQQLRQQGYRQGLLIAKLELRFGKLPQSRIEQICSASSDELERFRMRLLEAETLDDVLVN